MDKKLLRNSIRKKREELSDNYIETYSKRVRKNLFSTSFFKEAKTILSYSNIKNEISTKDLNQKIMEEKTLLLPKINKNDEFEALLCEKTSRLSTNNRYSIPEVLRSKKYNIHEIDLIIVPGIVFNKKGNRIGFGKGYYDKFLKDFRGITVSLAYPFQIVKEEFREEHDVSVDYIITSENVYKTDKNG